MHMWKGFYTTVLRCSDNCSWQCMQNQSRHTEFIQTSDLLATSCGTSCKCKVSCHGNWSHWCMGTIDEWCHGHTRSCEGSHIFSSNRLNKFQQLQLVLKGLWRPEATGIYIMDRESTHPHMDLVLNVHTYTIIIIGSYSTITFIISYWSEYSTVHLQYMSSTAQWI